MLLKCACISNKSVYSIETKHQRNIRRQKHFFLAYSFENTVDGASFKSFYYPTVSSLFYHLFSVINRCVDLPPSVSGAPSNHSSIRGWQQRLHIWAQPKALLTKKRWTQSSPLEAEEPLARLTQKNPERWQKCVWERGLLRFEASLGMRLIGCQSAELSYCIRLLLQGLLWDRPLPTSLFRNEGCGFYSDLHFLFDLSEPSESEADGEVNGALVISYKTRLVKPKFWTVAVFVAY